MPHPHRRRHRPKKNRAATWLLGLVCSFVFIVGLVRIVEWLEASPTGATIAIIGAVVLGLVGFVVLCCVIGRFGAKARNRLAEHSSQTDLGRFMRTNANFRAAREAVHRQHLDAQH